MLTVLIASRNGANTLSEVLAAYCQLEPPSGGWKLIIIDNGSDDETATIVSSFQSRLPLIYLFEPMPGKNVALNLGLRYVEGDLVVFSDDDSIPQKDWLVQMRVVCDSHPSFAVFAGKVRPRWQKQPADWILNWVPLGPTFTVSDARLPEGPTQCSNVFGPNMAVRREVFDAGHQFCASIGPSGRNYPMGSETEFVRRVARAGVRCWYAPQMVVDHLIEPDHLERSWILRRAKLFGRGQYLMESSQASKESHRWFGVPRFLVRQLLEQSLGVVSSALMLNWRQMFLAQWKLNFCCGQIMEARKIGTEKMSLY